MQPENFIPKPFRFSDSRQERIHEKLRLISPGAAPFYKDACRIIEADLPFDSTTHLVAHLIREIESSLRWALEPYKDHPEDHYKGLKQEDGKALLKKAEIPETEPIAKAWLKFMETLEPRHKDDIKAILKGLRIPETDSFAVAWLRLSGTFHSRAHRDNLAPPRPLNDEFRHFWEQVTGILLVVLDRLESQYLKSFSFLNDLLALKTPTREDAKKLQLNVPNNPTTYGYFFHRLNNPAWLKPLRSQKIFDYPVEPIYEPKDEGFLVTYPWWPQSRYLVRMAALPIADVQQTVLEIALQVETRNVAIHSDLVDVAKALPATKAVKLAGKEASWVESQKQLLHLLPEKLGELIAHLSTGGEIDTAIELARATLGVLPNPQAEENKDSIWRLHHDPVSRLAGWDYGRVLQISLSAFVTAAGPRALELFCDLLETAINFYQKRATPQDTDDYSDTWRRNLDHRSHDSVKDYLVSALHKSVELLAKDNPAQVPALVNMLEARQWLVFRRMALYLLRLAPDGAGNLITDRLTNRANFDERGLWHEYILLLRDQFNNLGEEQRRKILSWIDEGPSLAIVKERLEQFDGIRRTDEEAEKIEKSRKLRRLSPLREVLPADWKKRYDDWVKDTEEPKDPEYINPYSQEQFNSWSPERTNVLDSKSVKEILTLLKDQERHLDGHAIPSPEGLATELTALVAENPGGFAKKAGDFRSFNQTYVSSFLYGILDAITRSKPFDWRPIFTLCRWVLRQAKETSELEPDSVEYAVNWVGVRPIIAKLLLAGFKQGIAEIPFTLRNSAWNLLKPFTEDPQPTPEEERRGETERDFATYAINTVRGDAMHTVMHYALWVQRHIKEEPDGEKRAARGLNEMPEVRRTLEAHLDPRHDPSLAIRAVYGQWLPSLIVLDQDWVKRNLSKVFPPDEDSRDLLIAAWEAYIRSWGAYVNIFEVLHDEYRRAIDRIGEEKLNEQHTHTLDQLLAQHLMWVYSYGKLDLDDPEGLLARFYAKASDSLCGHALWHVGYTFHELKEAVHPVVQERFQALWQKRLTVARSAPESHVMEMTAFGYLFYSEKFDDAWAIAELNNALEISKRAEPGLFVVQRLAELANDYPKIAIKCLNLMVEGAKEEWALSSWGLPIRTIIIAARRSDEVTRQIAFELVNRLAARDHPEFMEMVSDNLQ